MKTMLSLLFLCLTFTAKPLVGTVDAASDAVLDVYGEELQTGASYYIVANLPGGGGGLALPAPTADNTCPIGIIQEGSVLQRGLPVAFSPAVNTTESVIRVSTDLNVKFSGSQICEGSVSPVWKIDTCDHSRGQWFVTIGGVEGNPGPQTLSNWFKIEKYEREGSYKLVHCPSVCHSCVTLCSDIGRYVEDGVRHLALSHQTFPVGFIKADVKSANKRIFNVI